jgi:hypothetical protein
VGREEFLTRTPSQLNETDDIAAIRRKPKSLKTENRVGQREAMHMKTEKRPWQREATI